MARAKTIIELLGGPLDGETVLIEGNREALEVTCDHQFSLRRIEGSRWCMSFLLNESAREHLYEIMGGDFARYLPDGV